jgi:hypothetical protein
MKEGTKKKWEENNKTRRLFNFTSHFDVRNKGTPACIAAPSKIIGTNTPWFTPVGPVAQSV